MPINTPSALILLYPHFNALDINGPIEVFYNTGINTTIAAKDELTTSQENVTIQRHISLPEAARRVGQGHFDYLIVPGSRGRNILPHLGNGKGDVHFKEMIDVMVGFAQRTPTQTPRNGEKELLDPTGSALSLDKCKCQGERAILAGSGASFLLASCGILSGMKATTHRLVRGTLRSLCDEYQKREPRSKPTTVVPEMESARYVDGGVNEAGVRAVTTSGPLAVVDAALYLVGRRLGTPAAEEAAMFLGHQDFV